MTKKRVNVSAATAHIGERVQQRKESGQLIPIHLIRKNPRQPRRFHDESTQLELNKSVKEKGVLQPIILHKEEEEFTIVAGERRYDAALVNGLKAIPAVIKEGLSDIEMFEMAATENLSRQDMNAFDEVVTVLQLLQTKYNKKSQNEAKKMLEEVNNNIRKNARGKQELQPDDLSVINYLKAYGITIRSFVSNKLPVLNFQTILIEKMRKGQLAYTKAKIIQRLDNDDKVKEIVNMVLTDELSVMEIEKLVKEELSKGKPKRTKLTRVLGEYRSVGKKISRLKQNDTRLADIEILVSQLNKLFEV